MSEKRPRVIDISRSLREANDSTAQMPPIGNKSPSNFDFQNNMMPTYASIDATLNPKQFIKALYGPGPPSMLQIPSQPQQVPLVASPSP